MSRDREIVCPRVVVIDSEFNARKGQGERPDPPSCFCAIEFDQNGRVIEHRLAAPYPTKPPWERGDSYLAVGYALSAEAGSMLNIGWTFPLPAVDLYAEYMTIHNTEMSRGDDSKEPGPDLIKACRRYGVVGMDKAYKEDMRSLAYTKDNHTPEEIALLQDYCIGDCWMTARLFVAMRPDINLPRAPIRGAFMMEIERMRWRGIPIDVETYRRAERCAPAVVSKMRTELNRKLGAEVYYFSTFKRSAMFRLMQRNGIPIPVDPKTGKDSCATKLIKSMIETYPLLKYYYEDKRMIDAVKNLKLEIGHDNRNRFWLNPFGTKTGRNNPSTNRAIFGLPHTMRSFMKPSPGRAFAQVDYGAQEIGIAGALSRDPVLIADYLSGDPYKQFAREALGVQNPTEQERQIYKATVLGRIYGLGVASLARNLGIPRQQAQRIIDQMTARYPALNAWLERIGVKAAHCVPITCTLGWSLAATGRPGEERTFLNFPMQGNGSELARLVIVRAGEAGLNLIGCVHDGFLIEDSIDRIEQSAAELQEIMRQASRDLLGGFELRADCNPAKGDIVRYPDRFVDKREREDGMVHWDRLMALIAEEEQAAPIPLAKTTNVSALLHFVKERESIRIRKESGEPRPWTVDPILRDGSFCNVERERDAVTCWIREHWRDPYRDDPDVWFLMVVARLGGNDPRILAQITPPLPWDHNRYLAEMTAKELKIGVRGYKTWLPRGGGAVHEHLAHNLFSPLWAARHHVRPRPGDSCQAFYERLREFNGLGSFLAAQVVVDTKFTTLLRNAPDWSTFAVSGPGSRRGLNRVLGRPTDAPWSPAEWRAEFDRLKATVAPDLQRMGRGELSASDFQSVLCEVDKMIRWRSGEVRMPPRRKQQTVA